MSRDLPALFAQMAPVLGLSRPAAQCLGAIWRAAQAPSADDLVARLGLSRSNISVALKELRALGLVQTARSPGSRKDYFTTDPDPWALLRQILAARQRRDLAPLADRLRAEATDPHVAALAAVATSASEGLARLAQLEPRQLAQILSSEPPRKKKKKKG
ncbi:GbsR/MarR family transcriptional regulator [Paenirhodobacter sp.]|uniref:GbsR/MarR family transcriptional regulator n=1 Tax=Paenirhodobacter sp. TaxID=1965326 RepID=UPI003B40D3AF